jgi:dipeptidyl aminopeptidase/acylaminoacyl peptidase
MTGRHDRGRGPAQKRRGGGPRGRGAAERDLRARLHSVRAPGEDAAAGRALGRVLEAHAATPVAPRRRVRRAALVAAAAAVLVAVVAAGLTSPGQAVGDWLRDVVHSSPKPKPAPVSGVPPGRVLTAGRYRDATWSPHGRFAAVTTASELRAITAAGVVRWRVLPPAPPRGPAWSPDGFRLAYLAGPQLRVVVGDGTDDRLFWGHARDVAPAFRPTAGRTVAWVERDGHIRLADVDRAQLQWRSPATVPAGTRALSWSADGRRILAAGHRRAVIFGLAGTRRTIRGRFAAAGFPPVAGPPALLERRHGSSSIRLLGTREPLISTAGRYHGLQWSPDGRWLITRWDDQWLYVRRDGRRVLTAPGHGTPLGWAR